MATIRIEDLQIASSLDGSEYLLIVQGETTKRVEVTTAAISHSLDLQTALNALTNTPGAIFYRNATQWTYLAAGPENYVLRSGGANGNLYWAAS